MLVFMYRDAEGIISERRLETWGENSRYLQGYCRLSNAPRTYRKDRIIEFSQGEDLLLGDKAPLAPEPAPRSIADNRPQIVFTGFKPVDRTELEKLATDNGLRVVKSATQKLAFLCGGYNAGPVKIKKAHEAGAFILTADEFVSMLETGEVPC